MHSILKLLAGSIVAFGAARTVAAGVKFAGVNIAGFDFGCDTDVHPPSPHPKSRASTLLTASGRVLASSPPLTRPSPNTAVAMALAK